MSGQTQNPLHSGISPIPYIKVNNKKIKTEKKKSQLSINITKKLVDEFPNIQQFKIGNNINPELIECVCNCIENLVKKKHNIDKKEFAIEILAKMFNLNDNEKNAIGDTIEYLHSHNIFRKIPLARKLYEVLKNYIKSKLG